VGKWNWRRVAHEAPVLPAYCRWTRWRVVRRASLRVAIASRGGSPLPTSAAGGASHCGSGKRCRPLGQPLAWFGSRPRAAVDAFIRCPTYRARPPSALMAQRATALRALPGVLIVCERHAAMRSRHSYPGRATIFVRHCHGPEGRDRRGRGCRGGRFVESRLGARQRPARDPRPRPLGSPVRIRTCLTTPAPTIVARRSSSVPCRYESWVAQAAESATTARVPSSSSRRGWQWLATVGPTTSAQRATRRAATSRCCQPLERSTRSISSPTGRGSQLNAVPSLRRRLGWVAGPPLAHAGASREIFPGFT
jgi:hypothetical protein